MDHSGMDGHGDVDMGEQCSMNMLFTFSTKNLCIVFPQWRVTGPFSLLLSVIAVILLVAGYEAVREWTKRYELSSQTVSKDTIAGPPSAARNPRHTVERKRKVALGVLYAVQVFYSFFIMLLFMTYNGWIMLSVAVGAFVGYMTFSESSASRSISCH